MCKKKKERIGKMTKSSVSMHVFMIISIVDVQIS